MQNLKWNTLIQVELTSRGVEELITHYRDQSSSEDDFHQKMQAHRVQDNRYAFQLDHFLRIFGSSLQQEDLPLNPSTLMVEVDNSELTQQIDDLQSEVMMLRSQIRLSRIYATP